MKINNVEFDFKISRLKDAARMDLALQHMGENEKKLNALKKKKDSKLVEVIQGTLDLFKDFFIETTETDVLNGCDDVEEAAKMYYEFLEKIKEQKDVTLSAYSPDRIK